MKKASPDDLNRFNEATRLIAGGWKVPDAARRFGLTEDRYFKIEQTLDVWRADSTHSAFDGSMRRVLVHVVGGTILACLGLYGLTRLDILRDEMVRPVLRDGDSKWQKTCEYWDLPMSRETVVGLPQDTYAAAEAIRCK